MKTILITGAEGFIGAAVAEEALSRGYKLKLVSNNSYSLSLDDVVTYQKIINGNTSWDDCLAGVDLIIHCAAKAHDIKNVDSNILNDINTLGAKNLAEQAEKYGVKKLLFISTVGVYKKPSDAEIMISADDPCDPQNIYAKSKYRAEKELSLIAQNSQMKIAIVRAPTVYGEGMKGQLLALIKLIDKSSFLPFAKFNLELSSIYIGNLTDLLLCIGEKKEGHGVFLASDGQNLSLAELVDKISSLLDKKLVNLPIPKMIVAVVSYSLFKVKEFEKIAYPMKVDISKTKKTLMWSPPHKVDDAWRKTIGWYLKNAKNNHH
jgi:nucleoside-diphosphate-sugar epimerase